MHKQHKSNPFIYILIPIAGVIIGVLLQRILMNGSYLELVNKARVPWWFFLAMLFRLEGLSLTIPYAIAIGYLAWRIRTKTWLSLIALISAGITGTFVAYIVDGQTFGLPCRQEDCFLNRLTGGLSGLISAAIVGLAVMIILGIVARRKQIHN